MYTPRGNIITKTPNYECTGYAANINAQHLLDEPIRYTLSLEHHLCLQPS